MYYTHPVSRKFVKFLKMYITEGFGLYEYGLRQNNLMRKDMFTKEK